MGVASAWAARSHPVLLALLGGVAVVASSLATIVVWAWYTERLSLSNALVVSGTLLLVGLGGLLLVCVPAMVASVLVCVIRSRAS